MPHTAAGFRNLGAPTPMGESSAPGKEAWRSQAEAMNPGPSHRLPSMTQPGRYFGPMGSEPEDFPAGPIKKYIRTQRKAGKRLGEAIEASSPPTSPKSPAPRAHDGALPGVAIAPEVATETQSLPPSVRIATYYSPEAWGIGVKEIGAPWTRPSRPPPVESYPPEEQPYHEQELVVPRLPLEHFDDSEFEKLSPEEWLKLGEEDGGTPAVSKYYEDGELVWAPCRVIGYDADAEEYEIRWDATNKSKRVKRLNLRFEAEDPELFQARCEAAAMRRERQHGKCRLQRYVDEVEQEPVRPPSEDRVSHILRCVAAQVPVEHLPVLEECVEEMHTEYRRAVKHATVQYQMMDPAEAHRLDRIDLPQEPPKPEVPGQAQLGIPEPRMDFAACNDAIRSNLFSANEHVTKAQQKLWSAYQDVKALLFISVGPDEEGNYMGPKSIEEFKKRQREHVDQLIEVLNIDWRGEALHGVVNHLEDIFDFKQYSFEAYKDTHLYRFLRMITLVMGQQLRELMENSILHLNSFINTTIYDKGSPGPVFLISMCLKDNQVKFEPSLEEVSACVLATLDDIFIDAAKVMKIDSEVFPIMELPAESLSNISPLEGHLQGLRAKLAEMVEESMKGPRELQEAYSKFDELVGTDIRDFRDYIAKNDEFKTKEKCQEMAEKYQNLGNDALKTSENEVRFSLVEVDCRQLKRDIEEKAMELANATLDQLVEILRAKNTTVHSEYQAIFDRVQEQPQNPEELTELKAYVESRAEKFEELDNIVSEVNDTIGIFAECNYVTPDDVFDNTCQSNVWPSQIADTVKDASMKLEADKQHFIEALRDNQMKFEKELDKTSENVKKIAAEGDLDKTADLYEMVMDVEDKLKEMEEKGELYNSHEALLGFPPTEYPQIIDIGQEFTPYAKLWRTAGQFNESFPQWMDGSFFEIDPDRLEKDVADWVMSMNKMKKQFKGLEAPTKVCVSLLEQLNDFSSHAPLVSALRNPGLRERHWATLSAKLDMTMQPDPSLSLRKFLEMDIETHLEALEEVSEFATKEYTLERTLDSMYGEWKPVLYDLMETKDGESYILRGVDEMQQLLDAPPRRPPPRRKWKKNRSSSRTWQKDR